MNCLLGLDLGTSSVKGMLLSSQTGQILGEANADYNIHIPSLGYAEQDPEEWYEKTCQVTRQIMANSPGNQVSALSFSGQMHGLVAIDRKGNPVCPAIIWPDQRSGQAIEEIYRKVGREFLAEHLQNRISAGFLLASLYWLKENQPDIYGRIYKVMLPKDYINFRLTGQIASDYSSAASSVAFDNIRLCWAQPVLEKLDIDPAIFPECSSSIHVIGQVTETAAAESGLPKGTLVVNGGGDTCMANIGIGIIDERTFVSNIGTGGQIATCASRPIIDPELRVSMFSHVIPDCWNIMGACLSAGNSLKWFSRSVLYEPNYQLIDRECEKRAPGCEGLLFLPHLAGIRTPYMDPTAKGMFVGLTLKHDRFHMARAVMEGVAFSLRDCLEIFLSLGLSCDKIVAAGGGAASPFWLQLQADIYGRDVYRSAVKEQACYGAAFTAGVGCGVYADYGEPCAAFVKYDQTVYTPSPKRQKLYDEYYKVFSSLYHANKATFRTLHRLGQKYSG